ncbi:hypothetical protein GCM10009133_17110 [Cocleimonas flava]|uniref:Uncharacterized protein n=1 Tax=Cocleimonas flava TaxID=634765 RepID=A0A4R1ESR5_9GAMM|nr:hypothetical protein [Cocleimonas flava]TCJ84637.1 hypothetical protein EV695_2596 [Cocleimonas flava]
MESKIPLPTDNIYKFYAMFGLLLLITSILGTIWVGTSTNEKLHYLVKEYESIPGTEEVKEKTGIGKFIEARIKAQVKNKQTYIYGLSGTTTIAILLMFYGFRQWHTKIQPKQDEYFDLQLQKLKREIESTENKTAQK